MTLSIYILYATSIGLMLANEKKYVATIIESLNVTIIKTLFFAFKILVVCLCWFGNF